MSSAISIWRFGFTCLNRLNATCATGLVFSSSSAPGQMSFSSERLSRIVAGERWRASASRSSGTPASRAFTEEHAVALPPYDERLDDPDHRVGRLDLLVLRARLDARSVRLERH